MRIEFTVHGEPQGKGRPQFSTCGGHITARTPKKTVVYENLVKMEYQNQCGGFRFPDGSPLDVRLIAYYTIPKSAGKRKAEMMRQGVIRPTKKPDSDNIIKSVLDALNGIAYHDDSQVVDCSVSKFYGETPKVIIKIKSLQEE